MSSPKAASAKTARRPAGATQAAAKRVQTPPAAKPAAKAADGASADAKRLAAEIERALAGGQRDLLSDEALQALMAAVCKVYGARVEAGEQLLPLPERGGATATDVMVTASGLLKSANLAVFELGMWQSWTGR
ncbi:MAG: hypothetical protein QOI46_2573 [Alphaproteobacteria bacterium]|jgi:hypothetical protein|nr:hypothetical protein [Alphaproteobacteria bacterium]